MAKNPFTSPNPLLKPTDFSEGKVTVPYAKSYEPEIEAEQINQYDEMFSILQSYDDIREYNNKILNDQFNQILGVSPFNATDETHVAFNPQAQMIESSEVDTEEQKAFKQVYNTLVKNKGRVESLTAWEYMANNSMTNGFVKLFTGNDLTGDLGNFDLSKDGIKYDGKLLNLAPDKLKTLYDFYNKVSGIDAIDKADFIDKMFLTMGSLAVDIPLMYVTGGIAAGGMKALNVTNALSRSTTFTGRLLAGSMQQAANFNLLGLPQTISSLKEGDYGGVLDSIWHNALMGSLAGAFGAAGAIGGKGISRLADANFLGKSAIAISIRKNPVVVQELSAAFGSMGMGYTFGKLSGASDTDALAQGLAFSALHFTNPIAWKRALVQFKNKPIMTNGRDYFRQDGNNLYKIDTDKFMTKGEINDVGGESLELNKQPEGSIKYINEIDNYYNKTFRDALTDVNNETASRQLYERWAKELEPNYVERNSDKLRLFANNITRWSNLGKQLKGMLKTKLPEDTKLNDVVVKLSNDWELPYSDVKKYVAENLPEYFTNPDRLKAFLDENHNPKLSKDLITLVDNAAMTFVKNVQNEIESAKINAYEENLIKFLESGKELLPTKTTVEEPTKKTGGVTTSSAVINVEGKVPDNLLVNQFGQPYENTELAGLTEAERKATGKPLYIYTGLGENNAIPATYDGRKVTIAGVELNDRQSKEVIDKKTVIKKSEFEKQIKEKKEKAEKVKPAEKTTKVGETREQYVKRKIAETKSESLAPAQLYERVTKFTEEYNASRIREAERESAEAIPELVTRPSGGGGEQNLEQEPQGNREYGGERTGQPTSENERQIQEVVEDAGARFDGINKPSNDVVFTNPKTGNTFTLKPEEFSAERVKESLANDVGKPISELPKKATKEELAAAVAKGKKIATVPIMITKAMESELRAKGYTDEQINKMTPQEANDILNPQIAQNEAIINEEIQPNQKFALSEPQGGQKEEKSTSGITEPLIESPTLVSERILETTNRPSAAKELATLTDEYKGKGYDNDEIKTKLDEVWNESQVIADRMNEFQKEVKVKPEHVFATLMKLERKNGNEIAALYNTKFPGENATYKTVSDWLTKSKGGRYIKDKLGEAKAVKVQPVEEVKKTEPTDKDTVMENVISKYIPLLTGYTDNPMDLGKVREYITNKALSSKVRFTDKELDAFIDYYTEKQVGGTEETAREAGKQNLYQTVSRDLLEDITFANVEAQVKANVDETNARLKEWGIEGITAKEGTVRQEPGMPIRTAVTLHKDGIPSDIIIDKYLGISPTVPEHEVTHTVIGLASNATAREGMLKKRGWAGEGYGEDWVNANETLVKDLMDYNKSGRNDNGFFQKIKEFAQRMSNFLRGKGWYSEAEFFRRFADGTLDLNKVKEDGGFKIDGTELYSSITEDDLKKIITNYDEEEAARQLDSLHYYLYLKDQYPVSREYNKKLSQNVLIRKARGFFDIAFNQAAMQNRNYAHQITHERGYAQYKHPVYNRAYTAAENMVLKVGQHINEILENPEGWNKGKEFLALPDKELMTSKYGKYSNDIADGKREPIVPQNVNGGETIDQFMDRVAKDLGYNEQEKAAEKHIQVHARQTQMQRRNGFIYDMTNKRGENGELIAADMLTKKELQKYFGDKLDYTKADEELYTDANKMLETDNVMLKNIIDSQADKLFPRYYGLYRNEVRPSDPSYYLIDGIKPLDKNGNVPERNEDVVEWDRFSSYAKNEKEAKEIAAKWNQEGYGIRTFEKIGNLIRNKQWDKLTANQLMNLVDSGHIDANDQVVKALMNAIKTGNYDQHTIEKKYIKGMHYTPEELEYGIRNLTRESVNASTKKYGLSELRNILGTERRRINNLQRDPNTPPTYKDRMVRELDYAVKLYNQVAHSDNSFVDNWRQAATTWYIGIKPSFWFQQLMQPLQTTLPEVIKEAKGTGISGFNTWSKAFSQAFDITKQLHAEQKGYVSTVSLPDELMSLYKTLDNMHLMGAVGIEELAGKGKDVNMRYGSDLYKGWHKMLKVANLGGATAEKFTRLHALSVAYELGKAKGLSGTELENYTVKFVKDSMSGWGALDRPAISQPRELGASEQSVMKALTKSFFTFKTFTNANLGQYDRLFRNRAWGALGAKLLVGLGMHGVTKFPLLATLYGIMNLFSDNDMEHESLALLDELDNKIGGKVFSNVIGKGVISSIPGVDINLQNLFDERTAFATDTYSETRSKSAEGKLMEAMLGAPYGLAKDVTDASVGLLNLTKDMINTDEYLTTEQKQYATKNLFKLTPLFFRNILNAMTLATDGVQVKGKQIVKSDDLTSADIVYKVLGFNPSKVADAYEEQFNGLPAKLSRANGRITELKKIRKEIASDKGYNADERSIELHKIANLLREVMAAQTELKRQSLKNKNLE